METAINKQILSFQLVLNATNEKSNGSNKALAFTQAVKISYFHLVHVWKSGRLLER